MVLKRSMATRPEGRLLPKRVRFSNIFRRANFPGRLQYRFSKPDFRTSDVPHVSRALRGQ
ncbi:hypothetical protein PGT21_003816 [Puccinia graminis f. sp. tritici]|uniref:Uncharacterized protein n=1 Tax=Puccinia graminis f. sp. tritici TaxID=56615 RepID=A0A5B0SIV5_PUCGR|nr:hypothetical protein PGT21_003816 [Puccinia graminis f. sp. tritici]KAA1137822.1 hypothetical protein PGTUg99_022983 [Puccinia graminis f. sp. tritici]